MSHYKSCALKAIALLTILSLTVQTQAGLMAHSVSYSDKNPIQGVLLFPNPASQVLNVQLPALVGDAELTISNMFGQDLVKTRIITGAIFAVNLDNLIDGMYLVSITTDGRTAKYKLVVRR